MPKSLRRVLASRFFSLDSWFLNCRVLGLVVVLSCLVFGAAWLAPFFSDDQVLITQSAHTKNPFALWTILSTPYWGNTGEHAIFRPLVIWTLALNTWMNGFLGLATESTFLFRLTNTLLHAATAFFVFRLGRALKLPIGLSVLAAVVFCVHPFHAEALHFVVNRSEILAAFWSLLFVTAHVLGKDLGVTAIPFVFALLSKESSVALLPVVVGFDLLTQWPLTKKQLVRYSFLSGVVVVWGLARFLVVGELSNSPWKIANPLLGLSALERLPSALAVQWLYFRELLLPSRLVSDFHANAIPLATGFFDFRVLASMLLFGAAGAWCVRNFRIHPLGVFAVLSYVMLFFPASNLLVTVGPLMAERLAYSPSIPFCFGVAACVRHFFERNTGLAQPAQRTLIFWLQKWGLVACIALLAVYAGIRTNYWRNTIRLFSQAVVSNPESFHAYYQLGQALQSEQRFDAADAVLQVGVAKTPQEFLGRLARGYTLVNARKNPAEAKRNLEIAMLLNPRRSAAWHFYILALQALGQTVEQGQFGREFVALFGQDAKKIYGWKIDGQVLPDMAQLAHAMERFNAREFEKSVPLLEQVLLQPSLLPHTRIVLLSTLEEAALKSGNSSVAQAARVRLTPLLEEFRFRAIQLSSFDQKASLEQKASFDQKQLNAH